MIGNNYRVAAKFDGVRYYLIVPQSGRRNWTRNINEATTWPTANEAQAFARDAGGEVTP